MEIYMQMKDLALEGNLVDNGWIENLKYESGKTNLNAVMILSEIVYWYRPTEIRDEYTGQVIGYKKKFKADKLQKSYEQLGNRFGLTKNQVKDACDFLKNDKKVIDIEFRTVETKMGKLPNIMFIEPIMENLIKITGINRIATDTENPSNDEGSGGYPAFKSNIPQIKKEDTPTFKSNTLHRLQTEISTENTKSVSQSVHEEKQTDGQTDDTLNSILSVVDEWSGKDRAHDPNDELYKQGQVTGIFVKSIAKKLYTNGQMPEILKMGLTFTDIRQRLEFLQPAHIDWALDKTKNGCKGPQKDKYFSKALLTGIVECAIDEDMMDIN